MGKLQKIMFIAATVQWNLSSKEDWAGETIERIFFSLYHITGKNMSEIHVWSVIGNWSNTVIGHFEIWHSWWARQTATKWETLENKITHF